VFLRSSRPKVRPKDHADRVRAIPERMLGEIADIFERDAQLAELTRPAREQLNLEWQAWSEASSRAFLDAMIQNDQRHYPTFQAHHAEARARRGLT
jgi:hypothetical protein